MTPSEIVQLVVALAVFGNTVVGLFTVYYTRRTEKNTNSMKDALVKTTGESEKAKGVIQGRHEVTMELGSSNRVNQQP